MKGLSSLIASNQETSKKGDNTLDLLRKQSLSNYQKGSNKELEALTKNALINQQLSFKSNISTAAEDVKALLAMGWKELVDASTGKKYYWNLKSNETTWTKPEIVHSKNDSTDQKEYFSNNNSLPDGWVKKIHPATQQAYYLHLATNKSSFTLPTSTTVVSGNNGTSVSSAPIISNTIAKKLDSTITKEKKRKEIDIDPLDPTGGMVIYIITCFIIIVFCIYVMPKL